MSGKGEEIYIALLSMFSFQGSNARPSLSLGKHQAVSHKNLPASETFAVLVSFLQNPAKALGRDVGHVGTYYLDCKSN